jgi:hypothetical protein
VCRKGQKITKNGRVQAQAALKAYLRAKIAMLNDSFSAAC